ncbi:MAG: LysM peptidoglycan-binding domain-containing protein [Candidatus Hydrogenedentes bacterium]|nr:LysM peptidoglycan-binding domain-containing protein [Candidatus Hydrogenedentota bacterium]
MRIATTRKIGALGALAALFAAGCVTTTPPGEVASHQFDPLPSAEVGRQELQPVRPRTPEELLAAAEDALESANAAQERGDHEAALRDYTMMLELLVQADVEPEVFYNMRADFGRILGAATEQMRLAGRNRPKEWRPAQFPGEAAEGLPIPEPLPERIARQREKIQQVYPKNFCAGLNRSAKYLPYIQERFVEAGLPRDLVWLAMVESQFHPSALSRAGAAGMWQFMPSTGRRYGLRVDSYVDERYDWKKATGAAIAYLTDLYEMFGRNWPLAVSAYNCGEQRIDQVVNASGGERDLWRLLETRAADRYLRLETKEFYPKLCASVLVAREPAKYGFSVSPETPDNTVQLPVKGYYALEQLDQACGLSSGTLKALNPQLRLDVTPFDEEYALNVPATANDRFLAALKTTPQLQPGVHVVKRGESPSRIAARYGVSTDELMRINKIKSARRLQVGQRLIIPGAGQAAPSQASYAAATGADGRKTYRVRPGDCLYDIAKAHNVTVKQLQEWNGLGRRSKIHVDSTLFVSAPGEALAAAPSGQKTVHTVKKGECAGTIASRYGVDLADLLAWNSLTKKSTILPGQRLVVYSSAPAGPSAEPAEGAAVGASKGAAPESAPSPAPARKHKVAKGENPWTIAKKYGVSVEEFLAWNKLDKKSVLQVGDECLVCPPDAGTAAPAPTKVVHTVTPGQNPSTIAAQYGVGLSDLFKWNGWSKPPVLQVDSQVIVYQ